MTIVKPVISALAAALAIAGLTASPVAAKKDGSEVRDTSGTSGKGSGIDNKQNASSNESSGSGSVSGGSSSPGASSGSAGHGSGGGSGRSQGDGLGEVSSNVDLVSGKRSGSTSSNAPVGENAVGGTNGLKTSVTFRDDDRL